MRLFNFLFRVYDIKSIGVLERASVEGVLKAVYGVRRNVLNGNTSIVDSEETRFVLDEIFCGLSGNSSTSATTEGQGSSNILEDETVFKTKNNKINFSQFERYTGNLTLLSSWISNVLLSLFEAPAAHMLQLEKKYSSTNEPEEVMSRYNISKKSCDALRQLFYSNCGAQKAELSLSRWMLWCNSYLSPPLAAALFRAKTRGFKVVWRFADFADFCLVYGTGSLENRALALSKTFYLTHKLKLQQKQVCDKQCSSQELENYEVDDFLRQMRTMVLLLAQQHDGLLTPKAKFSANFSSPGQVRMKTETEDSHADKEDLFPDLSLEDLEINTYLSHAVRDALTSIEHMARTDKENPSLMVRHYVDLIMTHHSNLPGVRELSLTACCLFGIRPPSPHLEKEYVMEIMLRRQAVAPQTSVNPFGPIHTEWCIISKVWWDSWRYFVGKMRQTSTHIQSAETPSADPGAIDNWVILKKTGAKQLIPGYMTGQQLEVIPPTVYAAVHYWYGGGPKIMRKVVATANGSELELFPLYLRVCTCDSAGKKRLDEKEYLFSKSATIAEVAQELGEVKFVDVQKVRLWNYAQELWRDQYILSPEITLEAAALQDGQLILMEISLNNGTWPRSQLHSSLLEEADAGESDDSIASVSGKNNMKINSGRVGLDNLGNTCYLNASVQALLHTSHLMDFFLAQTHMRHINVSNKHGYGGRLAYQFGRLANEVWSTTQRSITPRVFCGEVGSLNAQFAGHQQQDAQELLDFLLVGLSEDLNLVEDKPYMEMPDSDGRPESELADIWWGNHQKRDLSVITSLFSGQFKSSTACDCGHTSARYEPYTLLSVAIPEDIYRGITVHVFLREISYGIQCRVGVLRTGNLQDVVNALLAPDFKPSLNVGKCSQFVAAEVVSSRVKCLYPLTHELNTISDSDNIFLFEILNDERPRPQNESAACNTNEDVHPNASLIISDPENIFKQKTENLVVKSLEEVSASAKARIAFVQRKIRLIDSGGMENFQICVFGLPIMDVFPTEISGAALYSIISKRVEPYLLGKVETLQSLLLGQVESHFLQLHTSAGFTKGSVRPITDEEAVGGAIPPMGFVLRYVTGGNQTSCTCSRCPWLARCRGCLIPQNDELIQLADGETIAIDWHMIVFEEMINTGAIMKVHAHPSAGTGKTSYESRIPLSRCFEKFTEDERLEGFLCAKCKSDTSMKRNFKLWRLPPVLVVQLKRFQFDQTSRRKLNNHIDFPHDGLDLMRFIAESRKHKDEKLVEQINKSAFQAQMDSAVDAAIGQGENSGTIPGLPLTQESDCSVYDLYAVVHHIGALSGGHYVTTIRESRKPRVKVSEISPDSSVATESESSGTHDSQTGSFSDRWWLFNDGQVTSIQDNNEISAATAYLLFYARRDTREKTVSDLFPEANAFSKDRTADFSLNTKSFGRGINERLQEVGRNGTKIIRRITGSKIQSSADSDADESSKPRKENKQECTLS